MWGSEGWQAELLRRWGHADSGAGGVKTFCKWMAGSQPAFIMIMIMKLVSVCGRRPCDGFAIRLDVCVWPTNTLKAAVLGGLERNTNVAFCTELFNSKSCASLQPSGNAGTSQVSFLVLFTKMGAGSVKQRSTILPAELKIVSYCKLMGLKVLSCIVNGLSVNCALEGFDRGL